MTGGLLALAINVVVSGLFAAVFLLAARSHPAFRHLGWIGAAWGVGAGAPAAEFLLRITPWTAALSFTGYACFSAGAHLLAHGLSRYYRRPLPRRLLPASFIASLAIRVAIWGGQRNTMPYELFYQLPFVIALTISAIIVWSARRRSAWDRVLAGCLWLLTLTFASKPVAAILLGSGDTARDYAGSAYSIYSQAASGLAALATGIAMMAVVLWDFRARMRYDAEINPATGLLTRRGFCLRLPAVTGERSGSGDVMLGICEFPAVATDPARLHEVIRNLRMIMPGDAILGHADESCVAILLPGIPADDADITDLRQRIHNLLGNGRPVAAGWITLQDGEDAGSALVRAEGALFLDRQLNRGRRNGGAGSGHPPTSTTSMSPDP
jgi:GGDEF domain-containing protein